MSPLFEHWVGLYGYPAIVLGTIVEGETILIMAGMVASWGYLDLPVIMVMAFIGSFSGDQMFFFLGPKNSDQAVCAAQWVQRYGLVNPGGRCRLSLR